MTGQCKVEFPECVDAGGSDGQMGFRIGNPSGLPKPAQGCLDTDTRGGKIRILLVDPICQQVERQNQRRFGPNTMGKEQGQNEKIIGNRHR